MDEIISIKGVDKAELLAELYNNSHPQGLGFTKFVPGKITPTEAQQLANKNGSWKFDYLQGRVMKVDLRGDTLDTWGYNRDNGEGAAHRIVEKLRTRQSV